MLSLHLLILWVRSWCKRYMQWRQVCFLSFQSLSLSSLYRYHCAHHAPSPALPHRHSELWFPVFSNNRPRGKSHQQVGILAEERTEGIMPEYRTEGTVKPGRASALLCLFRQKRPLLRPPLPLALSSLGGPAYTTQTPPFSFHSCLSSWPGPDKITSLHVWLLSCLTF